MPPSPRRSLRHEYELYIENEIEAYKESVPRSVLLKLGDEAVAALRDQPQFALTELIVWEEVDRIIAKRLRLPAYATWKRKRLKSQREQQRPEHWGLAPDDALAREVHPPPDAEVLVTGGTEQAACFLAAHGYHVYAVAPTTDAVEKIVDAAHQAGLDGNVRAAVGDLRDIESDIKLGAVVCTSSALEALSEADRNETIEVLQERTADGGVHVVTSVKDPLALGELSKQYRGWQIRVQSSGAADGAPGSFVAKKGVA